MRWALMSLLFLVIGSVHDLSFAQDLDDPRLDRGLRVWLENNEKVPVMVRVSGTISDARTYWRALRRSLASRDGEVGRIPENNSEFFAVVSRDGLAVLLASEEVVEVYRPFEMTFPGDVPDQES
jgi:hypothetical protein